MTNKIQTYAPCRERASDVCQWSSKRTILGIQKNYHIFSTVSGFRREHFRWNYDELQGSQCTFSRQNFAKPFLLRHFRTMQILFTPPGWITWSYQWKKTWRLWTFKHLLVILPSERLTFLVVYLICRHFSAHIRFHNLHGRTINNNKNPQKKCLPIMLVNEDIMKEDISLKRSNWG